MTSPSKVSPGKVLAAARKTTRRGGHSSTRRALLENAATLFATHGYAGTSLDEVVAAARVTKGALYHHFPSKLALFESVYAQLQADTTAKIVKRLDAVDDPWDRARTGLESFLQECREPQYRRICLQEAPVALGHERWVEAERAASYGIVRTTVDAILDELGDLSELSEAFGAIFFGAIRSSSEYVADADDADQAAEEVQGAIDAILAALRLLPDVVTAADDGADETSDPAQR